MSPPFVSWSIWDRTGLVTLFSVCGLSCVAVRFDRRKSWNVGYLRECLLASESFAMYSIYSMSSVMLVMVFMCSEMFLLSSYQMRLRSLCGQVVCR